jgi:SAM-dependent methyltransferase
MKIAEIKQTVKERYSKCAEEGGGEEPCCPSMAPTSKSFAAEHGLYGQEELSLIPETALKLSKGCGNPTGFANLQCGEVVVDFGCGAGIDIILAAHKVGPDGKVVGVDFSPSMIMRAQQVVAEPGLKDTVELLVADMEQLELPDGVADVVISNCVINLCPDKAAVYREAFRILKPGGRLAISDVFMNDPIDPGVKERFQTTWAGCVGGSIDEEAYFALVREAGFGQIDVRARYTLSSGELESMACCPGPKYTPAPASEDLASIAGQVMSIKFTARKPLQ